jgi:hypothetical protein
MNKNTSIATTLRNVAPWALATLAAATVAAQTPAPVQAKADPFGLPIAGPVMAGGTDAASNEFATQVLPSLTDLVNTRLSETKKINDASFLLDPSKLVLKNDSDVRVYFVGEGAGYHNTLGMNDAGPSIKGGNPQLLFPDASSQVSSYQGQSGAVKRTSSEPLLPGDFVDVGAKASGTKLDFFLISDGANGGRSVFSTTKSANPDGINHVVSFATAYSSYLLISFEDMYGGGDRDFNDVVFAVDIGKANLAALTATPEPGTWLTLGSFLGAGVWFARRRAAR